MKIMEGCFYGEYCNALAYTSLAVCLMSTSKAVNRQLKNSNWRKKIFF